MGRILEADERGQQAVEEGRGIEHQALVCALFKAATKPNAGKEGITAAIFLLKARHGYREGVVLESEHNVRITVELPAALSPEQYRRVLEVQPRAARAIGAGGGGE